MIRFRIKKGVRPYSGRIFWGERVTHPNGTKSVVIYVTGTATAHKNFGNDPRRYATNEVEEVE